MKRKKKGRKGLKAYEYEDAEVMLIVTASNDAMISTVDKLRKEGKFAGAIALEQEESFSTDEIKEFLESAQIIIAGERKRKYELDNILPELGELLKVQTQSHIKVFIRLYENREKIADAEIIEEIFRSCYRKKAKFLEYI